MGARLIKATEHIIAAIVPLFRWWFRQIGRQDTFRGKAIVACVGPPAATIVIHWFGMHKNACFTKPHVLCTSAQEVY